MHALEDRSPGRIRARAQDTTGVAERGRSSEGELENLGEPSVSLPVSDALLAALCDEVTANREVVIIHRRGAGDVALIAAEELSGLLETAHLLRSPANAERLLTALARAQSRTLSPQSLDELRREVGLGDPA